MGFNSVFKGLRNNFHNTSCCEFWHDRLFSICLSSTVDKVGHIIVYENKVGWVCYSLYMTTMYFLKLSYMGVVPC